MTVRIDFFFYGTLRDREVREVVMGPRARTLAAAGGSLPGYRCAPVEGGRYPVVVADVDGAAEGLLVQGVGMEPAARLSYFEGEGHDYDAAQFPVLAGGVEREAWVFVPRPSLAGGAGVWDMEIWRRRHRHGFLTGARSAMAGFGGAELARYRAAWTRRLAQSA